MRTRMTCACTPAGAYRLISGSTIRLDDGMIRPMRAVMIKTSGADAGAMQARNNLVTEERQLVDVVDERHRDAGEAGLAQVDELLRHMVGVAHDGQAAHALGVLAALGEVFLHRHGVGADVLQRQDAVDRRPVGVLDDAVLIIVLRLAFRRLAGDDAHRIDAELAPQLRCGVPGLGDAPGFMITGRVPPQGFGLPRMPVMCRYFPSKSKSSLSDQIILMTSIHS